MKFGIDFDFDGGSNSKSTKRTFASNDDNFNPYIEEVSSYLDDENYLLIFPLIKLKSFCKENGIKEYSTLAKKDIVNFIMETSLEEEKAFSFDVKSSSKQNSIKKTTSKKIGKITFDSIAGLEKAKEAFKEKVILPFEHPEAFEKFGKKVGGGILLYGLPGTGKTMFAEAASNEIKALFIPINCSDIKS